MKAFFWLRMLALVKQAAKALNSIAESQRILAAESTARMKAKQRPRLAEVYTAPSPGGDGWDDDPE